MPLPGNKQQRLILASALLLLAIGLWSRPVYYLMTYQPQLADSQVLQCAPAHLSGPEPDQLEAMVAEVYADYKNSLARSDTVEQRLFAVLLDNSDPAPASILPYLNESSDNRFVCLHFLRACSLHPEDQACTAASIETAVAPNRDNAVAWALVAAWRASTGDDYGTATALRLATEAPLYDDLNPTHARLATASIPETDPYVHTVMRFNLLARSSMGMFLYMGRLPFCSRLGAELSEINDYCLALGESLEAESTSIMNVMLGRSRQQEAYRIRGDRANALRIEQGTLDIYDSIGLSQSADRTYANLLLAWDKDLQNVWLDAYVSSGEVVAQQVLLDEAIRRSADPDYQPCPQPGLRFEFPFFYFGEERIAW
ncbi:MAG: hypothetical protein RL120_01285 [Gammaproteobacteria bacterium]